MKCKSLSLRQALLKRIFDFCLSIILILLFGWLILLAWILSSRDTKMNGLFLQKRIGRDGKVFSVFKIRTMVLVNGVDTTVTSANDCRITKLGKLFRRSKIDELPQLFNVLIGQMSFVGPRPDVPGYADKLEGDDRVILTLRPGITGPASLKYKNEEQLLAKQSNSIKFNNEIIWPDKVKLNKRYVHNYSFMKDLYYIFKTIFG